MRSRALLLPLLLLPGCGSEAPVRPSGPRGADVELIRQAERRATPEAWRVLVKAREMTLDRREVIQGGCWDYVNCVYDRAGFPEERRTTVYKRKKSGPYADPALIRPGDWLYFVNHAYGNIEHSGLFVDWTNRATRQALILSYAGEQRREPARYQAYDISHVYAIFRPRAQ
jgi:hypothetical protein